MNQTSAEQVRSNCSRHVLFETSIGWCGIAWSEQGVTRLQLPESSKSVTEKRLTEYCCAAADQDPDGATSPEWVTDLIDALVQYTSGTRVDFSSVEVDLSRITDFDRAVYETARTILWGECATYGELAERSGFAGGAQAVGRALSRNPVPIIIPCHRILASGNKAGGFSAFGGTLLKQRLLALEGVRIRVPSVARQLSFFD